jgi:hypothetical protein
MSIQEQKPRLGTLALHAGQEPDPTTTARAVPIYATSSYVFKDAESAANLFGLKEFGNIYSRLMNPTNDVLEKRLAALDGGVGALAFASGQAAITASTLTITHAGQNFISATSLYGGTWTLFTQTLKKLGVEVRFFNPDHPEEIEKLVDENTRLVYLESVGNPKNDVPDFRRIADVAHKHGLPVIVDNTVLHRRSSARSSTASTSRCIRRRISSAGMACISAAQSWIAAIFSGRTTRRSGRNLPSRAIPTTASFSRKRSSRSAIWPTSSTSAPIGCAIPARP